MRSPRCALALGLAAACAVIGAAAAPTTDARPGAFLQEAVIQVGDDFFLPPTVRVTPGTTVVWQTTGTNGHTVTSETGLFDSGINTFLRQGDTFQFTFEAPGTYPYYCLFHGGPGGVAMAGTIIVEAPAPAPADPSPTPTATPLPTETPTPPPSPTPTSSPTAAPAATDTPSPSPTTRPPSPQPPAPVNNNDDNGSGIAIPVIGGLVGLAALGLGAAWWFARRQR